MNRANFHTVRCAVTYCNFWEGHIFSPSSTTPSRPTRWLVVRFGHLGDIVLTSGVLLHWGLHLGWRFDFLTRAEWGGLLEQHPFIDNIVGLPDSDLASPRMLQVFHKLATDYTGWGLVDLHGTLRSHALSLLWKGPVLRYPKLRIARHLFLLSRGRWGGEALCNFSVPQRYALAASGIPYTLEPDKKAVPIGNAPAYKGWVPPARSALLPYIGLLEKEKQYGRDLVSEAFEQTDIAPVALHPYATHPYKTWPKNHWYKLAELLDKQAIPWILLGRGDPLFPGDKRDYVNRTTLRETCALLSRCRGLVSGDSGPMHLACAVGTPVLALFGPTSREWGFYPTGPRDLVFEKKMSCRPCSLHGDNACQQNGSCLTTISPEEVCAAVTKNFSVMTHIEKE